MSQNEYRDNADAEERSIIEERKDFKPGNPDYDLALKEGRVVWGALGAFEIKERSIGCVQTRPMEYQSGHTYTEIRDIGLVLQILIRAIGAFYMFCHSLYFKN